MQCPVGYRMGWCRRGETDCTVLVNRNPYLRQRGMKSPQDRAQIEYSVQQGTLTITKKKLQTWDTGVYWCALGPRHAWIREVALSVFKSEYLLCSVSKGGFLLHSHCPRVSPSWQPPVDVGRSQPR